MTEKDNRPKYIEGIGWRYDTQHSMQRRMEEHDYTSRCIYMITLTLQDRSRPLLGHLQWETGHPENARIIPTPLGMEVKRCWEAIPHYNPGVQVLRLQLMPDHLHGLLFVTRQQERHLGKMVNGFKAGCNKAFREMRGGYVSGGNASGNLTRSGDNASGNSTKAGGSASGNSTRRQPKHPEEGMLFAPGYQDSVLKGKNQLEHMIRYMEQNPMRLATKKEHPDLFRVVRGLSFSRSGLSIARQCLTTQDQQCLTTQDQQCLTTQDQQDQGAQELPPMQFAAIGNRWLLDRPIRMQVRCHNNSTPENLKLIARQKEYFLRRGRQGGVVVSPCISAGEKEIARAAIEAGVPLVVILENGFPPLYKPPGRYFEACAEGRLLMLAPWPYHMEKRPLTRQQCLQLNAMAHELSTEPWGRQKEEEL